MKIGYHPLRLTVRYAGDENYYTNIATYDFVIEVSCGQSCSSCSATSLTLDSRYVEPIEYKIGYPQISWYFDPSLVTLTDGDGCRAVFHVSMTGSNDIDESIFTQYVSSNKLYIYTIDLAKEGIYNL